MMESEEDRNFPTIENLHRSGKSSEPNVEAAIEEVEIAKVEAVYR
jgi:hypothetical protein